MAGGNNPAQVAQPNGMGAPQGFPTGNPMAGPQMTAVQRALMSGGGTNGYASSAGHRPATGCIHVSFMTAPGIGSRQHRFRTVGTRQHL